VDVATAYGLTIVVTGTHILISFFFIILYFVSCLFFLFFFPSIYAYLILEGQEVPLPVPQEDSPVSRLPHHQSEKELLKHQNMISHAAPNLRLLQEIKNYKLQGTAGTLRPTTITPTTITAATNIATVGGASESGHSAQLTHSVPLRQSSRQHANVLKIKSKEGLSASAEEERPSRNRLLPTRPGPPSSPPTSQVDANKLRKWKRKSMEASALMGQDVQKATGEEAAEGTKGEPQIPHATRTLLNLLPAETIRRHHHRKTAGAQIRQLNETGEKHV